MPTPTYTPLANITLSSSAASVTFSSISQAYRDLVLVVNATSSAFLITFNGDSGSNYTQVRMSGNGTTASSSAFAAGTYLGLLGYSAAILNVMDYSATDKHKSSLQAEDQANATMRYANRWANNSAITTLAITGYGSNLPSGTSIALYGIAA